MLKEPHQFAVGDAGPPEILHRQIPYIAHKAKIHRAVPDDQHILSGLQIRNNLFLAFIGTDQVIGFILSYTAEIVKGK